jgi:hypothetical protein
VEAFRIFSETLLKAYERTFDRGADAEPRNVRTLSKTE